MRSREEVRESLFHETMRGVRGFIGDSKGDGRNEKFHPDFMGDVK
jgi:hypothetical protein